MGWTLDRYRDTAAVWHREDRRALDPFARFIRIVDHMFYVAAAAFAVSIVTLLFG